MVTFLPVPIRMCYSCCSQSKLPTNASNLRNVMVFSGKRRLFVGKRRYKSSHLSIYSLRTAESVSELCASVVWNPCFCRFYILVFQEVREMGMRLLHDMITCCELTICMVFALFGVVRSVFNVACVCFDSQCLLPVYLLTWPLIVLALTLRFSVSLAVQVANQWQWW